MLDLTKLSEDELNLLKTITQKVSTNSELDRLSLFTYSPEERAKIFIYIYQILTNINEVTKLSTGKTEIFNEIKLIEDDAIEVKRLLIELKRGIEYGSHKIVEKISIIVSQEKVNRLINLMSVLNERMNLIDIARFKGILLEGKSGEEYKRMFEEKKEFVKTDDESPFVDSEDLIKKL